MRYKITNISQETKTPRNVFSTECGRLLKPGDSAVVNRINASTKALVIAGIMEVKEGQFDAPALPVKNAEPPTSPVKYHEVVVKGAVDLAKQAEATKPAKDVQAKAIVPESGAKIESAVADLGTDKVDPSGQAQATSVDSDTRLPGVAYNTPKDGGKMSGLFSKKSASKGRRR